MTWRYHTDVGPRRDLHVWPDVLVHDTVQPGCVCGPRVEEVARADGGVAVLVVHHSLDGREAHERQGSR